MKGSVPILVAIALSACAARDPGLRKPAPRTLAQRVCPQPGSAEQAQAALSVPPGYGFLASSDETLAFGPTRIIWVHPPDDLADRCR